MRRCKKKYLVISGYVESKNDGQWHFISADKLMKLFKVNPEECVVYNEDTIWGKEIQSLIQLKPRYDGDYSK